MLAELSQRIGFFAKKPYVSITSRLFSSSSFKSVTLSKDPIKRRQQLNAINLRRRTDVEWHEKEMTCKISSWRRLHQDDPEQKEQKRKWDKEKYHTDPVFKLSQILKLWLRTHTWVREELPWKTHRPVLHTTPVRHRCEVCGIMRLSGMLLFWRSIAQPDSYSCHRCYVKQGAGAFMPKGYEDIRRFKDLVARKEQLERPRFDKARARSTAAGERLS